MQNYIPLYIHGGIGDLIISLPFIELFKDRGIEVTCYTLFPEVLAIYLPWVNIAPRAQLHSDSPDWHLEVTDVIKFKFRELTRMPEFLQEWYRYYLTKYPEWVRIIDRHPHSCNEMGIKALEKGLHRTTLPHYFVGQPYIPHKLDWNLTAASHITVHDGFDSSHHHDVSMKSWPMEHWVALVDKLKVHGPVFQIGGPKHRPIPNVDINYANKLSFRDSLKLLYSSDMHIDSDSGLVHARHLTGKPSIVLFGPTISPYFGYPENINIDPKVCGGCWWKKKDWMEFCVNGYEKARCMHSIDPHRVSEEFHGWRRNVVD